MATRPAQTITRSGKQNLANGAGNGHIQTAVKEVPITAARPVPEDLDKYIDSPGVPRANKAVSKEVPNGSDPSLAPENMSVIQQHVRFWDRDGDGVIWPSDTFVGFRRLGFNLIISTLAVPFIHGSFSYPSGESWIPDPFFRVHIKNMHKCKHGSDSEVYDTEGRFVPQKFEEIFTKYDKDGKGGLTWEELQNFIWGMNNIVDPNGWTASRLEWWVLYALAAEDGVLSKERIRANYDGSLFFLMADDNEQKKQQKLTARKNKQKAQKRE